jgi:hypothetical protein
VHSGSVRPGDRQRLATSEPAAMRDGPRMLSAAGGM